MSNTNKVTQLPTAQVVVSGDEYVATAARWKQLLDTYPPKDGWAALVEGRPAPTPLYYAGGNTAAPTIQFDATLKSPSGTVVANGSTLYIVEQSRDWECGETNARHRLLMALGFNPRKMDDDDRENVVRAMGSPGPSVVRPIVPLPAAEVTRVTSPFDAGEGECDPLAGLTLVDVGEKDGRQRKARSPRAKPVSVSVPVVAEASPPSDDENPLGPPSVEATLPSTLTDAEAVFAANAEDGSASASSDFIERDTDADIGTRPPNLGPLGDAVVQRAQQRGIGVDWTTIPDETSAVGWLLRHT